MTIAGPRQPRPPTTYFLALSAHFGIGRNFASDIVAGHTTTCLPFRIWMARLSMGLIPCLFALNKPLIVYTAIVASAARTLSRAPMC